MPVPQRAHGDAADEVEVPVPVDVDEVDVLAAAVLDELGADHVRTARAKGLGEATVVLRHTLRNALVPVVTLIGLQIGFLLGGAVGFALAVSLGEFGATLTILTDDERPFVHYGHRPPVPGDEG